MLEQKSSGVGAVLSALQEVEFPMKQFIGYFSSWHLLKRAAVSWIRFIRYLNRKTNSGNFGFSSASKSFDISADELANIELRLLQYNQ